MRLADPRRCRPLIPRLQAVKKASKKAKRTIKKAMKKAAAKLAKTGVGV